MTRFKVAICSPSSGDIEREVLNDIADVTAATGDIATEEAILSYAGDAHALLLGSLEPVTRKVIESMPNLRVLARYGIGLDNVDLKAATERGVVVTNDPDYALEEVADHAFTMALALTRRTVKIDRMMRDGRPGYEIKKAVEPIHANSSLTFGILGLGNIARRIATRAKALGFRVISYDPWVARAEFGLLGVERAADLETVLRESDVISVHVPLTPQTRHFLGEKQFALMKKSALIVNTSRGPVIDQAALYSALKDGRLGGAGLDVFEVEPLPADDPLRKLDNVILSPHLAWYSEESHKRVRFDMSRAVKDVLTGKRPEFVANPDVMTHLKA
ncbi:MAG: C-terminal binding protein [Thaumarchaeota archaeon]|nr:C-terminal binding protein [Nitrososphaerota archaeon]